MLVKPRPVDFVPTPGYTIWRRLLHNKPAMVGLFIIGIATLIALLGYLIMPDQTSNANNTIVQLQKRPPGFTVPVVKVMDRQTSTASNNLFYKMLFGETQRFTEYPFRSYAIRGDQISFTPYEINKALPQENQVFQISQFTQEQNPELALNKLKQDLIYKKTFWLGTDNAGRDVLSRLLLGTRISLGIGFVAVLISILIGVAIGAVAGYFGGWLDKFMLFLMTVVWSVPGIMLIIAISLALNSKGIWVSFVAVGLTMWVDVARVVRGQFLSLKEKTYIEAVKVLGLPQYRIIINHILPNMIGPLIVIASANFAAAILMEAGLSFLGLGVQPPAPSWGMMVNEGFQLIGAQAGLFLVLLPSACISLLVLSFNLLGNGLRDAYDPKIILTDAGS